MVKMTETETMYVGLNMFCAALMLRCVWLQVVMKIKLMLLPQHLFIEGGKIWPLVKITWMLLLPHSKYCSEGVVNF
jgi:hypothetical protein